MLKALIAGATTREQDVVHSLIVKRQLAERAKARQYRLLLYAASLMLLAALVYLGLQLRARAVALRRRAAFEHVIAGISTQFINSQRHEIAEHVVSALEKLAGCVGADRAYFVVAGSRSKSIVGRVKERNFRQAGPSARWISLCALKEARAVSFMFQRSGRRILTTP